MTDYAHIVNRYYIFDLMEFLTLVIISIIIFVCLVKKKKAQKYKSIEILIAAFLMLLLAVGIYDYTRDINCVKNNDYVMISYTEARYNTKFGDTANLFSSPIVATLNNGEEVYLESIGGFPDYSAGGNIVYLEKSRIILDYTVTDES